MINHLIECGILEKYLEENCINKNYKICNYKDDLGGFFMWDSDSPLYLTGGWEANKTEYNKIINDIYLSPGYWPLVLQKTIEFSFRQYFMFRTSVEVAHMKGSAPYGQIEWRYSDSLYDYKMSRQNTTKYNLDLHNSIQGLIILFSMVCLFFIVIHRPLLKSLSPELKWLIIIILLHGIISSIVCSNLSTVHPRFHNRIVWLLPLVVVVVFSKLKENKNLLRVFKTE